ncbi:TIGR02285 family protein [Rhodoferax sp. GW822-FHT02A01]|uniref:TIGR02285 family protein n=1 Tax=Rhodoferax sp. GW822-FHT02A01 TaxID=3141537 RepID=UPI00315CD1A4
MHSLISIRLSRPTPNSWRLLIGLCLFICLQIPLKSGAAEKPRMLWMVQDVPPGFILVNGKPTEGIFDKVIQLVTDDWPEVEHDFVEVTIPRGLANLSGGVESCFAGVLMTPERETFAYYSLMYQLVPLQLIVRPEAISRIPMNALGEVLLESLLGRADVRGIIEPQRSYGPLADAYLRRRGPTLGISNAIRSDSGASTLKMLMLNRADYTLEYDFILAYQQARSPELKASGLRALPIAGSTGPLVGFACPRTDWGRRVIKKIDALMVRNSRRPEYLNSQNRWLTRETVKHYKASQDAFFRQRTKPTDPAKYAQ